jgi:gliding motility-associated-like protein
MEKANLLTVAGNLQNRVLLWILCLMCVGFQSNVLAQQAPNISYPTPNIFPIGTIINLVPSNTGGAATKWSVSGLFHPSLQIDAATGVITGTPTQATAEFKFTVIAENGFGSDPFEVTVRIIPSPVYLIPFSPATICDDPIDPAGLSSQPLQYESSRPDVARIDTITNMIIVVGIGKTVIKAYNSLGSDTASLEVSDYLPPEILSVRADKSVLCPGANATLTVNASNEGKNPEYQWFLNGQPIPNATGDTYFASNPSLNDKFTVQVTNNDQCYTLISKMSDPVVLSPVPPPPTTSISLSPAGPTCAGTLLTFRAEIQGAVPTTGPSPKWYVNGKDAGAGSGAVFTSDKLIAGDVVSYIVPFPNPCGPAQAATSNEIVVEYRKAELCNILPPKAFSPNGDGVNDTWNIEYLVGFPNCHVRIFSRYGQKLYDSTGYSTPWDGSCNGKSLPTGTYYYVISLEEDMETVSGSITIIK